VHARDAGSAGSNFGARSRDASAVSAGSSARESPMPSSARHAAARALDGAAEPAAAIKRSTARAPRSVSRAIAVSRVTAFSALRFAISASICFEEEALMVTEASS
jgi:hypothetical protein